MNERVRVNPITCEAHGMCAELLPERVTLDDWGYPIVDARPLEPSLVEIARKAAKACPTFALLVEHIPDPASARRAAPPARPQVSSRIRE
jgi:ferredoxin